MVSVYAQDGARQTGQRILDSVIPDASIEIRPNVTQQNNVSEGTVDLPRIVQELYPENTVYVGAGADRSLKLYNRERGNALLRRCGADRRLRVLAALLYPAEISKGRLTIPSKLLNYAGIEDKAVVELTDAGVVIYRLTTPDCDRER